MAGDDHGLHAPQDLFRLDAVLLEIHDDPFADDLVVKILGQLQVLLPGQLLAAPIVCFVYIELCRW
jgi:hypothetical protein